MTFYRGRGYTLVMRLRGVGWRKGQGRISVERLKGCRDQRNLRDKRIVYYVYIRFTLGESTHRLRHCRSGPTPGLDPNITWSVLNSAQIIDKWIKMTTSAGRQNLGRLIDGRNPVQDASDGRGGTEPVSLHPLLRPISFRTQIPGSGARYGMISACFLYPRSSYIAQSTTGCILKKNQSNQTTLSILTIHSSAA